MIKVWFDLTRSYFFAAPKGKGRVLIPEPEPESEGIVPDKTSLHFTSYKLLTIVAKI